MKNFKYLIILFFVFLCACQGNKEPIVTPIPTNENTNNNIQNENNTQNEKLSSEQIIEKAKEKIKIKFEELSSGKFKIEEPIYLNANNDTFDESLLLFSVPYTLYEKDNTPRKLEYDVLINIETFELYAVTYKTNSGEAGIKEIFNKDSILTIEEMHRIDYDEKLLFLEVSNYTFAESPSKTKIAYYDDDKSYLWNSENNKEIELPVDNAPVGDFKWSPDEDKLLIDIGTSPYRQSVIINPNKNLEIHTFYNLEELYFSPDGSKIAGMEISDISVKAKEGWEIDNGLNIMVFDFKTGKKQILYRAKEEDTFDYFVDSWIDNKQMKIIKYEFKTEIENIEFINIK